MVAQITITNENGFDEIVIQEKGETRRIKHPLNNDFSAQRNLALKMVKSEWVLFLDDDEQLSGEIKTIPDGFDAFKFKRRDTFQGKILNHGETGNLKLLRLARKSFGSWKGRVHEVWEGNGRVGDQKIYIIHNSHKSIKEFISKINFYTDIRAGETKKFRNHELLKPAGKFLDNYFLKLGFLDGFPGFVMAFMMSLHSLIVRVKEYDFSKNI